MSLVCGKVGRDDMDSYSPARSSLGIADISPPPPISSDTTTIVAISCVCTLPCMS